MRFSDIAHTCAQNLLRRKSRTILTVLGVIVGCCSIVLMISIGQGISEQNEQMLKSMGNLNDITVTAAGGSGAYDSSGVGMSSLSSSDMTSSDHQACGTDVPWHFRRRSRDATAVGAEHRGSHCGSRIPIRGSICFCDGYGYDPA
mgnify:CR=1 FL=1